MAGEFGIGEDPFFSLLPNPDHGDFVFSPTVYMAVEAVVRNVTCCTQKPFGPRVVPLQHFVPWRKPVQFFCDAFPEFFRIGD